MIYQRIIREPFCSLDDLSSRITVIRAKGHGRCIYAGDSLGSLGLRLRKIQPAGLQHLKLGFRHGKILFSRRCLRGILRLGFLLDDELSTNSFKYHYL